MMAARIPTLPRDLEAVIDPTFATSIDTTSGITVMRMRLTKIVPTGVATASTGVTAVYVNGRRAYADAKEFKTKLTARLVSDTAGMVPPRSRTHGSAGPTSTP